MPKFTPADSELWFSIVDSGFQAAEIIVDVIKFEYALITLGSGYTIVRDIIYLPIERIYKILKWC